jgi:hypothetical protein
MKLQEVGNCLKKKGVSNMRSNLMYGKKGKVLLAVEKQT